MVQIQSALAEGVKAFLESGDRSFLETMRGLDRQDIEGQATVRYLMQLKHWPFTPDSDFAGLLDHFFGAFPDRKSLSPEEYQAKTFDLIKSTWGYECVVVVPEPRPEPEAKKPAVKSKASKKPLTVKEDSEEEGESGSRTFKSIRQQEAES
jgi:hypothetical protein